MPYSANTQLPESVRKAYSDRCQAVFRRAFNADFQRNKSESRAFRVAHTAAKNCERET
jgi:cation transport regulator ChaB